MPPLSLALCLDMIYNGAAGQTQAGMAQAMHLGGLTPAQVNQGTAALMASLLTADASATLELANSIWARPGVSTTFLGTDQTYYGANLGTLEGAPATVNAWVSAQTKGRIPFILDSGLDCSQLAALVVNAIYFKGSWTSAFDAKNTRPMPFTRLDGSQVTCQMMTQETGLDCAETAQATVGRLPYGNGRFAMVFLLPAPGTSLAALVATLDADAWGGLMAKLAQRPYQIYLPKFTSNWSASLVRPLTSLGMGTAFDPVLADFSAMAPGLHLDLILQKTTVAVDETGTVAAAATAGGWGGAAAPAPSK